MDEIMEMIKSRRAVQMGNMTEDKARFGDPFLGQFMRGRVAVEENDIEWLDKIIAAFEKL